MHADIPGPIFSKHYDGALVPPQPDLPDFYSRTQQADAVNFPAAADDERLTTAPPTRREHDASSEPTGGSPAVSPGAQAAGQLAAKSTPGEPPADREPLVPQPADRQGAAERAPQAEPRLNPGKPQERSVVAAPDAQAPDAPPVAQDEASWLRTSWPAPRPVPVASGDSPERSRPEPLDTPADTQQPPEILTRASRAEMRKNALVPIRFMITGDIPPAEAEAALMGVTDVLAASGQERELVRVTDAGQFKGEPHVDPDTTISQALQQQALDRNAGYGPQVDLMQVVSQIDQAEPYQAPHWEVHIVNHDVAAPVGDSPHNAVFGMTDPARFVTVQSVTRFIADIPPGILRNEAIRRLVRQEVGHMLGLPLPGRPNTEENLGRHCTNVCTMRQGVSLLTWAQHTVEEVTGKVHFCQDCQADLATIRTRYRPLAPADAPPPRIEVRTAPEEAPTIPRPAPAPPEFSGTPQRPAIIYVKQRADGSFETTDQDPEADPKYTEVVLTHSEALREVARALIPPETEYLNPQMDAFFAAKGLPSNPVYLLTPQEISALQNDLSQVGYTNPRLNILADPSNGNYGLHIVELGVGIVVNAPEIRGNPLFREYLVAHEKLHAANGHHVIVARIAAGSRTYTPGSKLYVYDRVGFHETATGRGVLVEEGAASSMGVEYISQVHGRWYGMWDKPSLKGTGADFLPPAYVWRLPNGRDWVDGGAFPGTALDVLKKAMPTLAASLIQARSTQQGLREVKAALDAVRPGLYDELTRLDDSGPSGRTGLRAILGALGKKPWEVM